MMNTEFPNFQKKSPGVIRDFFFILYKKYYISSTAACAAARRAIGTR